MNAENCTERINDQEFTWFLEVFSDEITLRYVNVCTPAIRYAGLKHTGQLAGFTESGVVFGVKENDHTHLIDKQVIIDRAKEVKPHLWNSSFEAVYEKLNDANWDAVQAFLDACDSGINLTGLYQHLGLSKECNSIECLWLFSLRFKHRSKLFLWILAQLSSRRVPWAQQVTELNLAYQRLSHLPTNFAKLTQLTRLRLAHNQFEGLPQELALLNNLTHLDASTNQLVTLDETISNLESLTDLNLRDNTIEHIEQLPTDLQFPMSLRQLDFGNNHLRSLPHGLCALPELVSLKLDGNPKLIDLGPQFSKLYERFTADKGMPIFSCTVGLDEQLMPQLFKAQLTGLCNSEDRETQYAITRLNLSTIQLTEIDDSIVRLKNLQVLDLSVNQLDCIPDSISALKKLTVLDITGNPIKSLPESLQTVKLDRQQWNDLADQVCSMSKLETLDLRNNELTVLPPDIVNLTQLRVLNLKGNHLRDIPDGITSLYLDRSQWDVLESKVTTLTNLRFLSLHLNAIQEFPSSVINLKTLEVLAINNGRFTEIPSEIGNMINLVHLDISSNRIASFPADLSTLVSLRDLNLSQNSIKQVPEAIRKLSQLEALNFRRNKLTTVPDWLGELQQLVYLNLRRNKLTQLPPDLLQSFIGRDGDSLHLDISKNKLTPAALSQILMTKSMGQYIQVTY